MCKNFTFNKKIILHTTFLTLPIIIWKKKFTRKYYYYYVHTTKHDQKTLKAVENHIIKKISMKVNYKTLPLQTIHTKKNLSVLLLYYILPYYQNYVETYTYTLHQKGWILYGSPCTRNYRGISILLPHTYGTPNYYIHHHYIINYLPLPTLFCTEQQKLIINEIIYAWWILTKNLSWILEIWKISFFCHFKKSSNDGEKK